MAGTSIPRATCAPTDYVQLTDSEGRLWLMPAAAHEHFIARGLSSISPTITLRMLAPEANWITLENAAALHVNDVDGLTTNAARLRIKRAIHDGMIHATGAGRALRVEPNSLSAWRLGQRDKNLDDIDDGAQP